jgi:hypothetical protein
MAEASQQATSPKRKQLRNVMTGQSLCAAARLELPYAISSDGKISQLLFRLSGLVSCETKSMKNMTARDACRIGLLGCRHFFINDGLGSSGRWPRARNTLNMQSFAMVCFRAYAERRDSRNQRPKRTLAPVLGFEADGVTLMRLEAAEITDGSRLNGEIKRRTDLTAYLRRSASISESRRGRRRPMNSLSLQAGNCWWRRWLRGTAIVPSKEIPLNLHRDLIQPFSARSAVSW